MSLFIPLKFKSHVQLIPAELGKDLNEVITSKLKKMYEGVCSRFGYVKPGSLKIIQRSAGQFIKQHFNGHIRFEVIMIGEVCNPLVGMIVNGRVKNKNQMGILAESFIEIDKKKLSVLDIIIPKRSAGIQSEIDLDQLEIDSIIQIEVLGKRYQLNDTRISIIGKAIQKPEETHPYDENGIDLVSDGMEGGYESDEGSYTGSYDSDPEPSDDDDTPVQKGIQDQALYDVLNGDTLLDGRDEEVSEDGFDDGFDDGNSDEVSEDFSLEDDDKR